MLRCFDCLGVPDDGTCVCHLVDAEQAAARGNSFLSEVERVLAANEMEALLEGFLPQDFEARP